MPWPYMSPDLNPIENIRQQLKIEIQQHAPRNLHELKCVTIEEWRNIP